MSKYRITIDGKTYEMEIELVPEDSMVNTPRKEEFKEFRGAARDTTIRVIEPSAQKTTVNHTGTVTSPMPGTIIRINKAEGEAVKTGEVVLVLEAMKMENEIYAPKDGQIVKIACAAGTTVAAGETLFEIG